MSDDTVQALVESERGVVTAAAGCGKTEAIALAVKTLGAKGRQLVLTHTHAGVAALRDRMRALEVPTSHYRIDTLAGWSLRYASHYPATSAVPADYEPEGNGWGHVYGGARNVLNVPSLRKVVEASYAGVFIDEYQDCTQTHHSLVRTIAEIVPCRVLGDPLQGIFDFAGDPIVDWTQDVLSYFPALPPLEHPWRWRTRPAMAEWLRHVRKALESQEAVSLQTAAIRWRQLPAEAGERFACQTEECWKASKLNGSVVLLRKWGASCYATAQKLKGVFSCMEEVECVDLLKHADAIDQATTYGRAVAVMEFAQACMSGVASHLKPFNDAARKNRTSTLLQLERQPEIFLAVSRVAEQDSPLTAVGKLMDAISALPGRHIYRRELWREMRRAVDLCAATTPGGLRQTAWNLRNRTRHRGRVVEERTVSRTLLVKGLEFEHGVLLDGTEWDRKNFYVAVTRPKQSLVVCAPSRSINPAEKS